MTVMKAGEFVSSEGATTGATTRLQLSFGQWASSGSSAVAEVLPLHPIDGDGNNRSASDKSGWAIRRYPRMASKPTELARDGEVVASIHHRRRWGDEEGTRITGQGERDEWRVRPGKMVNRQGYFSYTSDVRPGNSAVAIYECRTGPGPRGPQTTVKHVTSGKVCATMYDSSAAFAKLTTYELTIQEEGRVEEKLMRCLAADVMNEAYLFGMKVARNGARNAAADVVAGMCCDAVCNCVVS